MRKRHKIPFPRLTGFIAAPPTAYKAEFDVLDRIEAQNPFDGQDAAIIEICGPMTQHMTMVVKDGMLLFPPNYDEIRHTALAAFQSSAKVVVLCINSPGGDFAGSLELARDLRRMAQESGKPLLAFTDTQAASAGYALACAADSITLTPSAQVGSVGVWAMLCDETAADRAKGLNVAIVASGERKADRNPHVPITEGSIEALQAEVDTMASMFFDAVTSLRPISRKDLEALQGAQKIGGDAISAGLADTLVNSWGEFLSTVTKQEVFSMGAYDKARAAHRASLAKIAAEDSDDGKAARAELSEMDKSDEKRAKKAEADEKEAAKAEGEDGEEKKEAKAEGEDDKEKAKALSHGASVPSAGASVDPASNALIARLAENVQALRAELAETKAAAKAQEVTAKKAAALASRPDFTPEIKASLMSLSLAKVEEACQTWPKIGGGSALPGLEAPSFTRGKSQVEDDGDDRDYLIKESVEEFIDRKMSPVAKAEGCVLKGTTLSMGFMTKEQAAKRLADLAGRANKEAK